MSGEQGARARHRTEAPTPIAREAAPSLPPARERRGNAQEEVARADQRQVLSARAGERGRERSREAVRPHSRTTVAGSRDLMKDTAPQPLPITTTRFLVRGAVSGTGSALGGSASTAAGTVHRRRWLRLRAQEGTDTDGDSSIGAQNTAFESDGAMQRSTATAHSRRGPAQTRRPAPRLPARQPASVRRIKKRETPLWGLLNAI